MKGEGRKGRTRGVLGPPAAWPSGALPVRPACDGSPRLCPDPHSWEATASAARSTSRELAASVLLMAPLRNLSRRWHSGPGGVCGGDRGPPVAHRGRRGRAGSPRPRAAGGHCAWTGCVSSAGTVQTPESERVRQQRSLCARRRGRGAEGMCVSEASSDSVGQQTLPGTRRPPRLGRPMRAGVWVPGTGPTREPPEGDNNELIRPAGPLQGPGSARTFPKGQTSFLGRSSVTPSCRPAAEFRHPGQAAAAVRAPWGHTYPEGRHSLLALRCPRRPQPPPREPTLEPGKARWDWGVPPTCRAIQSEPRGPRKSAWGPTPKAQMGTPRPTQPAGSRAEMTEPTGQIGGPGGKVQLVG